MVLQCSRPFHLKVAPRFLRLNSQSSYIFGKDPKCKSFWRFLKKILLFRWKDFIFRFIYKLCRLYMTSCVKQTFLYSMGKPVIFSCLPAFHFLKISLSIERLLIFESMKNKLQMTSTYEEEKGVIYSKDNSCWQEGRGGQKWPKISWSP